LQVPFDVMDISLQVRMDTAIPAILGRMDGADKRQAVVMLEGRGAKMHKPVVSVEDQRVVRRRRLEAAVGIAAEQFVDQLLRAHIHGIVQQVDPVYEIVGLPLRRHSMEMHAIFDLFGRRSRMLTCNDMDFDALALQSMRKVVDMPGDTAHNPRWVLPAQHDYAHND